MSQYQFQPHSRRAAKARLVRHIHPVVDYLILIIAIALLGIGGISAFTHEELAELLIGLASCFGVLYFWIKYDLRKLNPALLGSSNQLDRLMPTSLLPKYNDSMSVQELWIVLEADDSVRFVLSRLRVHPDAIHATLKETILEISKIWDTSIAAANKQGQTTLTTPAILVALFTLEPNLAKLLTPLKLTLEDLEAASAWVYRIHVYSALKNPIYGGIARDWAAGYTPLLAQFGINVSQQIQTIGRHAGLKERTSQLEAVIANLDGASSNVAIIGEPGIGKSALLLGLADRLLQGNGSPRLSHYQVMALNASIILSSTEKGGDLERIVLQLFNEADHAGNIIIALDEAQLFFGQGTGAVNLSQVLLPILEAHRVKLILAMGPSNWQALKAANTALAGLINPVMLSEPIETEVMEQLEDRTLSLEQGTFATYQALRETYRLSGRYYQNEAYPGKALRLLEAAFKYPENNLITEQSVGKAIEEQFGVKATSSSAVESDALLHLEDKIHTRMINQTHAVSVVANALRRARAGIANPRRPIGSFLFLGPTGVGKTELAKSLAALYFGNEQSMIRVDMSEYQQVSDIERLLAGAEINPNGFLSHVHQTPFSVILFDEIEKAHPDVLNLFLQLLDEGNLTDSSGKSASFKDAIIIATSNAGALEIRHHIEAGLSLDTFDDEITKNLIDQGVFKPELINRFDEVVLFRSLNEQELKQVARLLLAEINQTLSNQKIVLSLSEDAITSLVKAGFDPELGARPMRRIMQRQVEDLVARRILKGETQAGDTIELSAADLS